MGNPTPKTQHLQQTQWRKGRSGNPLGKPKGTKNLSSLIKDALESDEFNYHLKGNNVDLGSPIEVIVHVLIERAMHGDLKAFDLLARYGYGAKVTVSPYELPTPILSSISLMTNADESNQYASKYE